MKAIWRVTVMIVMAAGCRPLSPTTPVTPPAPPPPAMSSRPKMMMQKGGASLVSTIASAAQIPQAMRVDLYQLQLPQGTISRNEKFWKRVDEQSLDPGTYELLYKTGVRVGQATLAAWDYLRQVMQQYPAVTMATPLVPSDVRPAA